MIIKIFKYIEPIWIGTNNKLSIRRVLALVFSLDFVRNLHHSIFAWEIGKSYADAAMLLGIEAGLVAALLSLTTYSNSLAKKQTDENE
jgi:hypothetical protein